MFDIRQTDTFVKWRAGLKDVVTRRRIGARIDRLGFGHFGDVKAVGGGVSELRIDFGPGYRVYFVQKGQVLIILLCGGDKSSQPRDIERAKLLAAQLKEDL